MFQANQLQPGTRVRFVSDTAKQITRRAIITGLTDCGYTADVIGEGDKAPKAFHLPYFRIVSLSPGGTNEATEKKIGHDYRGRIVTPSVRPNAHLLKVAGYEFTATMVGNLLTVESVNRSERNRIVKRTASTTRTLRMAIRAMVAGYQQSERAQALRTELAAMTTEQKIADSRFAYARYNKRSDGDYYSLYWKDNDSPTGRLNVGGCSPAEWEVLSVTAGKSHNYLSPSEKY